MLDTDSHFLADSVEDRDTVWQAVFGVSLAGWSTRSERHQFMRKKASFFKAKTSFVNLAGPCTVRLWVESHTSPPLSTLNHLSEISDHAHIQRPTMALPSSPP